MLCVWWDWKGIIHYELLPPGRTIDSELYCEQLMRLKQKVERKRPELINRRGVVFHHDNARPHTSLATQQQLRQSGWEVLMHPPYSDLTTHSQVVGHLPDWMATTPGLKYVGHNNLELCSGISAQVPVSLKRAAAHLSAICLRLGANCCEPHSCRCGRAVDRLGHHGVSCGRSAGRIPRHAGLNDIILCRHNNLELCSGINDQVPVSLKRLAAHLDTRMERSSFRLISEGIVIGIERERQTDRQRNMRRRTAYNSLL
ncbi:hypothetical protein K1T71_011066 [Dendrolimus kikuchii]|uniref:Uncharacterized protein n=1 Tax=Dendrolimus kikuchii TaxID=765133 RepID=A0ACC1CMT2_9NEOP|nr:hypothetical protein K1T71_011066 [Dendrolimus kikuchii]